MNKLLFFALIVQAVYLVQPNFANNLPLFNNLSHQQSSNLKLQLKSENSRAKSDPVHRLQGQVLEGHHQGQTKFNKNRLPDAENQRWHKIADSWGKK